MFRSVSQKLLLLLVSTAVTLGVAECAIRLEWVPMPARAVDNEGWWKEHWLRFRQGFMPKSFVTLDPELGWVHAPNLRDIDFSPMTFSTNSLGLRGTREYALEKTGPRVLLLGDSYAFGQCEDDDEAISAVMEAMLPGVEVMNLAVMGYGHDQMLLRMRRDGLPYEPDVVILAFKQVDVSRNVLAFRDYGKPRFALVDGALELRNVPVPTPEQYDRHPRFWNYARMGWDIWREEELRREAWELADVIIRRTRDEAEAAGARFAMLYLPRKKDLRKDGPIGSPLAAEICAEGDLTCWSPVERMKWATEGKDPSKHFRCHYSARFYKLSAMEAVARLKETWPELFDRPADPAEPAQDAGGG